MTNFFLRLNAIGDLWRRYADAFRYAWKLRARFDTKSRLTHETDFLPAVLALQESPPPAAPRAVMWSLILFAIVAVTWSYFGKVDMVASAPGKIVPSDRTKTIQSIETAVVRAIHVTDGQPVKAGDVLVELDDVTASADLNRIASDLSVARMQVARARAFLTSLQIGKKPILGAPENVAGPLWRQAQLLLVGQYAEYLSKLSRIDAQIVQREAEQRTTTELIRKLEKTVPIARQRADNVKRLAEQSLVSKDSSLQVEQVRIEQEADLAAHRSMLQELDAALMEARTQRTQLVAETRRINLDSINEGSQKVVALEQELRKASRRTEGLKLIAPVDGTVQQLAIHTIGGVVSQAQPLMMIVPADDALEVEALIDNKDIGFVRSGQVAAIKIETFQYTKYGLIDAMVTSVTHDAVNDEKRGLVYSTRVRMNKSKISVDGTEVSLIPGMSVSVEIKTGRRRLIEYFLNPFLQYSHESFRER